MPQQTKIKFLASKRDMVGELIGTFILVFFGCGSVATTVLFGAHIGLFQIAIIWGLAVTIAIYTTRHLSCAHLNPAVSIAMAVGGRMSFRRVPTYISFQFLGAFLAAATLYLLFGDTIVQFELEQGIIRGSAQSMETAKIFGEFYSVTYITAFFTEAFGTFILVTLIFSLTEGCNVGRPSDELAPLFIGMTITLLISILAPLTQAGFNPARDLAPRFFAWIAGWREAALPDTRYGFLVIYVLGPIVGGILASFGFTKILEPLMSSGESGCECDEEL